MKVTLAYPYEGHEPDDTVDLPDADARRLLSDGKARKPAKGARVKKTSTPSGGSKTTPTNSGTSRNEEE